MPDDPIKPLIAKLPIKAAEFIAGKNDEHVNVKLLKNAVTRIVRDLLYTLRGPELADDTIRILTDIVRHPVTNNLVLSVELLDNSIPKCRECGQELPKNE